MLRLAFGILSTVASAVRLTTWPGDAGSGDAIEQRRCVCANHSFCDGI